MTLRAAFGWRVQLFDTQASETQSVVEPLCFLLGRDHDGHWIVRETHGLCGGLFTSETAAIRYARFEGAGRASLIRVIPETIELNCSS